MRLVELANERDELSRVLAKVGLGPRPRARRRPALPGQLELELAACSTRASRARAGGVVVELGEGELLD